MMPAGWSEIPAGTIAVLRPELPPLVCFGAIAYEVAGDGDLIISSRKGNILVVDAGAWLGVGTVEHAAQLGSWIALEAHAA